MCVKASFLDDNQEQQVKCECFSVLIHRVLVLPYWHLADMLVICWHVHTGSNLSITCRLLHPQYRWPSSWSCRYCLCLVVPMTSGLVDEWHLSSSWLISPWRGNTRVFFHEGIGCDKFYMLLQHDGEHKDWSDGVPTLFKGFCVSTVVPFTRGGCLATSGGSCSRPGVFGCKSENWTGELVQRSREQGDVLPHDYHILSNTSRCVCCQGRVGV